MPSAHSVFSRSVSRERKPGRSNVAVVPERELPFFTALFSMLAKLAESDGIITGEEMQAVERITCKILHLTGEKRLLALKIFRSARRSERTFEEFARDYAEVCQRRRPLLRSMLHMLASVASADGAMTDNSQAMIRSAVQIFRLPEREFKQLFTHSAPRHPCPRRGREREVVLRKARLSLMMKQASFQCRDPFRVLGCDEGASVDDLRRAYRKLVLQFHPDTVIARGLPRVFERFAHRRFREIREAYEEAKRRIKK